MLKGYKTYITAALGALVTAAFALGYIDGEVATTLLSLLGFGGLAAMRAGAKKAEDAAVLANIATRATEMKVGEVRERLDVQAIAKKARKKG